MCIIVCQKWFWTVDITFDSKVKVEILKIDRSGLVRLDVIASYCTKDFRNLNSMVT